MGVLKIRDRWGIEWYDETGRRKRKVIEKPGEKIEGGWYEAAKKAYRDTKARLDKGEPPLFTTSKKTVAELLEQYWRVCKDTWSPVEADRIRRLIDNRLLAFFGKRKIGAVKRLHIEEYIAARLATGTAPAGVNKERARLHHFFNKCIEWGELSRNPSQGIKKLKEPPERVAYLDGDERGRLLDACEVQDATLRDIVSFAMLTGGRLGELLAVRWGNVDLRRRIISFRKTKSGKVRHVPINPDLFAVLMHLEPAADPAAPLFPPAWNGPRVTTAFRRIASGYVKRDGTKIPGVKPGFRFHDLRHDFASWLSMSGVPIRAVQTLLGHADLRMTERYSHLADRILVAAVQVLPALPGNGSHAPAIEVAVVPRPEGQPALDG